MDVNEPTMDGPLRRMLEAEGVELEEFSHKYYIWIGHPMWTHKNSIFRKTERATMDLKLLKKSSRQGAPTGVGNTFISSFLRVILKKDENALIFLFPAQSDLPRQKPKYRGLRCF